MDRPWHADRTSAPASSAGEGRLRGAQLWVFERLLVAGVFGFEVAGSTWIYVVCTVVALVAGNAVLGCDRVLVRQRARSLPLGRAAGGTAGTRSPIPPRVQHGTAPRAGPMAVRPSRNRSPDETCRRVRLTNANRGAAADRLRYPSNWRSRPTSSRIASCSTARPLLSKRYM